MSAVNDKRFDDVAEKMEAWQLLDQAWDDAETRRAAPIVEFAQDYHAGKIDLATFQELVRDVLTHISLHMFGEGFKAGSNKPAE